MDWTEQQTSWMAECERAVAGITKREMKMAVQVQAMAKHQEQLERERRKQAMRQQKEDAKAAEKEKRIVEKTVQEVLARMGKKQEVDAETILESLHRDAVVVRQRPSPRDEEELPPAGVPLPSIGNTDYGSPAPKRGAGDGGRQPPRTRD
jgi:hypothetical protein